MKHLILCVAMFAALIAGCGGGSGGGVRPDPRSEPVHPAPHDLLDYLRVMASGDTSWGPKMPLWKQRPTVRVWSNASADQHRMTAKAVDLINDWLPLEYRMRIGRRAEADARNWPKWGEIHVSFDFDGPGGESRPWRQDTTSDVPYMTSNLVRVNPNSRHGTFGIIVHELVHAMGFPGHVSEHRHPTSIMPKREYRGGYLPDEAGLPQLPRIDGEALMAAYTVFNEGHTSDEINATGLGPWAASIPAINGEVRTVGDTARFGAEYRTQWVRVWDEGPVPMTTLGASGLTGTVTWTGKMVGFTGAGAEVEGDARITVDVAPMPMTGTAEFTDIMAGGASWEGADLSTAVRVSGNHFADTENDPRMAVEGQFRGTGHEAVTGVLQWKDATTGSLTGAFGAIRN